MIDCKKYANEILDAIKFGVEAGNLRGHLAVISVGEDEPSKVYIRGKRNDCERVGFGFTECHFENDSQFVDIVDKIDELNNNDDITGIIVQLPLPSHLEPHKQLILDKISFQKDVDGLSSRSKFKPCTPEGIIYLLKHEMQTLEDKNIVVIGRGELVGRPLAIMLTAENANVTVLHSHTSEHNIETACREADAVVVAIGKPHYFLPKHLCGMGTPYIVDCGISRLKSGKLYGDVCNDGYFRLTPVPGGVGLLTRAVLVKHCARLK